MIKLPVNSLFVLICFCLAESCATSVALADDPLVPSRILRSIEDGWRQFPRNYQRDSRAMQRAFIEVVSEPRHSTVEVICDGVEAALGTVVDSDGYIITKSSEVRGSIECRSSDGRKLAAAIVARNRNYDVVLLKVDATDFPPIVWSTDRPTVGAWLASVSPRRQPEAIGVLSSRAREIAAPRGGLGIGLQQRDEGPQVTQVKAKSPAEQIGLQPGDFVIEVNDQPTPSVNSLIQTLRNYRPGDRVKLVVRRGENTFEERPVLSDLSRLQHPDEQADIMDSLGGKLSDRRSGFQSALQHDTILEPRKCGGPLVDLDGRAVGINIARASRVASYAIPADELRKLIPKLMAQNTTRLQSTATAD